MNKLALQERRISKSTASQKADKFSDPEALLREYQSLKNNVHTRSHSLLDNDEVEFIQRIDNLSSAIIRVQI